MTRIEVAEAFIYRFCSGDVESMEELLHKDLQFSGPLFQFSSRNDYLDSLLQDPPKRGTCRILSITENQEEISIYYEYGKEDDSLTVAQLFRFDGNKISEILVVFNATGLV